jgi:hypothetical protein
VLRCSTYLRSTKQSDSRCIHITKQASPTTSYTHFRRTRGGGRRTTRTKKYSRGWFISTCQWIPNMPIATNMLLISERLYAQSSPLSTAKAGSAWKYSFSGETPSGVSECLRSKLTPMDRLIASRRDWLHKVFVSERESTTLSPYLYLLSSPLDAPSFSLPSNGTCTYSLRTSRRCS